jgi:hypothetical protein
MQLAVERLQSSLDFLTLLQDACKRLKLKICVLTRPQWLRSHS